MHPSLKILLKVLTHRFSCTLESLVGRRVKSLPMPFKNIFINIKRTLFMYFKDTILRI